MLEHEPPAHSPHSNSSSLPHAPSSAASEEAVQARVTAEEFAAAVAALEARRAAQAQQAEQRAATTVPIGQAVDELGVNLSPDDIWAEVRAQRAQPRPVPPAQAAARKAGALLQKLHAGAAPLLAQSIADWQAQMASIGVSARGWQAHERHQTRPKAWAAVAVVFAVLLPVAFSSHHHGGGREGAGDRVPAAAQTRTLAEVRDGEPFSISEDALEKLQKAQDLAQTLVPPPGSVDNGWTLVKHDGHLYVRGYTLPLSDNALQVGRVKLYNDNNAGVLEDHEDQSVTLRLDALHVDKTDAGDDWRELDVSQVHPDAHTREPW